MQRLTVTVDDGLAALARAELVSELDAMTVEDPYDQETFAWLADALRRPATWAQDRLLAGDDRAGQGG